MAAEDGSVSTGSGDESIGALTSLLSSQPPTSLQKYEASQELLGRESHLENLPPELRVKLLLSMPDLETLHSAILASPVLHAQYQNNHDLILRSCLHDQLDGFLPDAIGTLMSRISEIPSPRTNDKINDFLAKYKTWLSDPTACLSLVSLDISAVHWLVRFHVFIAIPLSKAISRWAMANMSKDTSFHSPAIDAAASGEFSLSRPEQCRVLQAIYRTQTYHHLFGANNAKRPGLFRYDAIQEIYFGLFKPWETETIASVDMYIRDFYQHIFDEITEDLDPENPRYFLENGARHLAGSFDLESEGDEYMHGVVSRGLKIMMKFFRVRNDHEQLVHKAQRCLIYNRYRDATLKETLESLDISDTEQNPPQFAGDSFPPENSSLGWNLAWQSISPIEFNGEIPGVFRSWAYTVWDENWWKGFDPLPVLHAHWKETKDASDAVLEEMLSRQRRPRRTMEEILAS